MVKNQARGGGQVVLVCRIATGKGQGYPKCKKPGEENNCVDKNPGSSAEKKKYPINPGDRSNFLIWESHEKERSGLYRAASHDVWRLEGKERRCKKRTTRSNALSGRLCKDNIKRETQLK